MTPNPQRQTKARKADNTLALEAFAEALVIKLYGSRLDGEQGGVRIFREIENVVADEGSVTATLDNGQRFRLSITRVR